MEFDIIYTNGDNNLENLKRMDETWKVHLIEEEFQRLIRRARRVWQRFTRHAGREYNSR